jgi:hypothetical protein
MPKDWRYAARLANLDVTNAGLAGPNAADLFALMGKMVLAFPALTGGTSGISKTDAPTEPKVRAVFYGNRQLRYFMSLQAMRDRNVLLSLEDYAGKVVDTFRGIPVKTIDQILSTESRVV